MIELSKIDLGQDEAEHDRKLKEYFLKTDSYQRTLSGDKTIIIGRKGSGKSAIFTLLADEIPTAGDYVVKITPDQYSWGALKDYKEKGILPEQAHTNAWKLTLLSAVIWKLSEENEIKEGSKLKQYYNYMRDSYVPKENNWFLNVIDKIKKILSGVKTKWVSFDVGESSVIATPLKVSEELKNLLKDEWKLHKKVRILIDRLDDSWDASEESKHLIVGLLKASHEINSYFQNQIIVTTFIRSDIYDNLFFDDQDKLRQREEVITWNTKELKEIIAERVKVSLGITEDNQKIWDELFSEKVYRSRAKAEKYIIDRTFKRPRDIISFVRFCIQEAIKNKHSKIETIDTRSSEETFYSQAKYKDLIIEYQKQLPFIKDLLDSFSGGLHRITKDEMIKHLDDFFKDKGIRANSTVFIRILFIMSFIGIKKFGRAGIKQRGGTAFYYYYDDPSTNPLSYNEFFIHPALRFHLNVKEHREIF